jgi:hypothetical protein
MFDRILEVVGNVAVILLVNTPRQTEKKKKFLGNRGHQTDPVCLIILVKFLLRSR